MGKVSELKKTNKKLCFTYSRRNNDNGHNALCSCGGRKYLSKTN